MNDTTKRDSSQVELKPCPFCGGSARMLPYGPVVCNSCGSMGKEYISVSLDQYEPLAAFAWNRRA